MTLITAQLTPDAPPHILPAKVPNLSTDGLRCLLRLCAQDDALEDHEATIASHADLNTRELLRGRILDAFILEDRFIRLAWHAPLTVYVMRGDAKTAARVSRCSERTMQDQASKFLAFAVDWLEAREEQRQHRERARDADYQRRLAQCQEICGRKSFAGGGCNLNDWTGCQACPLLAIP